MGKKKILPGGGGGAAGAGGGGGADTVGGGGGGGAAAAAGGGGGGGAAFIVGASSTMSGKSGKTSPTFGKEGAIDPMVWSKEMSATPGRSGRYTGISSSGTSPMSGLKLLR